MKTRTTTSKKRTTAAVSAPDPLWLELAEIEGINPNQIGRVAEAKVREAERGGKIHHSGNEFRHPSDELGLPSLFEMCTALAHDDSDIRGYGRHAHNTAAEVALRCESELYNAWVRWYCLKHKLLAPGQLSEDDYAERYW